MPSYELMVLLTYAARRSRDGIGVVLGRIVVHAIAGQGGFSQHEAHGAIRRAHMPAGLDVRPRGVRGGDALDTGVELGGAAGVLDVVGRGSHLSASSSTWETEDGKMDALLSNSQSWEV